MGSSRGESLLEDHQGQIARTWASLWWEHLCNCPKMHVQAIVRARKAEACDCSLIPLESTPHCLSLSLFLTARLSFYCFRLWPAALRSSMTSTGATSSGTLGGPSATCGWVVGSLAAPGSGHAGCGQSPGLPLCVTRQRARDGIHRMDRVSAGLTAQQLNAHAIQRRTASLAVPREVGSGGLHWPSPVSNFQPRHVLASIHPASLVWAADYIHPFHFAANHNCPCMPPSSPAWCGSSAWGSLAPQVSRPFQRIFSADSLTAMQLPSANVALEEMEREAEGEGEEGVGGEGK